MVNDGRFGSNRCKVSYLVLFEVIEPLVVIHFFYPRLARLARLYWEILVGLARLARLARLEQKCILSWK